MSLLRKDVRKYRNGLLRLSLSGDLRLRWAILQSPSARLLPGSSEAMHRLGPYRGKRRLSANLDKRLKVDETSGARGYNPWSNRETGVTEEEAKEFLEKNPAVVIIGTLLAGVLVMQKSSRGPAWLKDLPSLGGRTNSAWRGKGSFGKGFGPVRVRHK